MNKFINRWRTELGFLAVFWIYLLPIASLQWVQLQTWWFILVWVIGIFAALVMVSTDEDRK